MSACVTWLRKGRKSINKGNAIKTLISESKKDSLMNCLTRSDLFAPVTFLTPTSFALFDARAVERFMKLMQAITWISIAINNKMYRKEGSTVLENSISYPLVV